MFGNAYGSTSLGDLQKSYYQQLETLSKMQQQQQMQKLSVLDEINRSVGSLSNEEQTVLAQSHDYQLAKQTYEAGFMAFISNKFADEYALRPARLRAIRLASGCFGRLPGVQPGRSPLTLQGQGAQPTRRTRLRPSGEYGRNYAYPPAVRPRTRG